MSRTNPGNPSSRMTGIIYLRYDFQRGQGPSSASGMHAVNCRSNHAGTKTGWEAFLAAGGTPNANAS